MPELRPRLLRVRGFTLVELVITFAILAILVLLATPSFSTMIRNAQIRSAAEALQNGLRLAQAEAVHSARTVAFARTSDAPKLNARPNLTGNNWLVQRVPQGAIDAGAPTATRSAAGAEFIEGGQFGDQTAGVIIKGPVSVCFDSDGRVVTNPIIETSLLAPGNNCLTGGFGAGVPAAITFNVTRDTLTDGEDRPLQVTVQIGGQVRMCDPARTLSPTTPDGC